MTGNVASAVSAESIQTPALVEGGGTIAISSIASSTAMFGSGFTKHMLLNLVPFVLECPIVGFLRFPFSLLQLCLHPCPPWLVVQLPFKGSPSEVGIFLVRILA